MNTFDWPEREWRELFANQPPLPSEFTITADDALHQLTARGRCTDGTWTSTELLEVRALG